MEVASVKKRCVRQAPPREWGMKNKRWEISIVDWGIWRQMRRRAACRRAPFILGWIGWHCWDGDLPSEASPPGSQPKHKVTQLWTSDDLCGSVPLRSLRYEQNHVRNKQALQQPCNLLAAEHQSVWDACSDGLSEETISQQQKETRSVSFFPGKNSCWGNSRDFSIIRWNRCTLIVINKEVSQTTSRLTSFSNPSQFAWSWLTSCWACAPRVLGKTSGSPVTWS